jgi:hypothetical protein
MEQIQTMEKEINMQDLDTKIKEMTIKYSSILKNETTAIPKKSFIQVSGKATTYNKKLEELTEQARKENTTLVEQVKYSTQYVLGKLKFASMPDKKTLYEYLEPVLQKLENLASSIYNCTAQNGETLKELNAEIKVILEERDKYRKDAQTSVKEYEILERRLEEFDKKGVSPKLKENHGTDLEVVEYREIASSAKNALGVINNILNNYEIRAQEYDQTALFCEIMNEIVTAGKQAYDDVQVISRAFKRGLNTPMKVEEMSNLMVEIDKSARYMSGYLVNVTKLTSDMSGLLVGLRVNDGKLTPGMTNTIRNEYINDKTGLETIQKEASAMKDRMYNLFP